MLALPASVCTSRLTPAFASARQTWQVSLGLAAERLLPCEQLVWAWLALCLQNTEALYRHVLQETHGSRFALGLMAKGSLPRQTLRWLRLARRAIPLQKAEGHARLRFQGHRSAGLHAC